jgi:hypothetical protein
LDFGAAPPAPVEHFGYTPGDDYKLADFGEIYGYFQAGGGITADPGNGDRQSEGGKPIQLAFISSEENLKWAGAVEGIEPADGAGGGDAEEAGRLAREGRRWSGSIAGCIRPRSRRRSTRRIWRTDGDGGDGGDPADREKVILLVVPIINPDGHDMVAEWYRGNVGTPHELAPLPKLYHKYAGHDNNRDWFMMNLKETRHVSRMLYEEWFPQIVYNQHQTSPFPSRIFIPPYAEPLNPAIPAPVMNGIGSIGAAMRERFSRENKPGAISYVGFDAWWNGGARSTPAFHNMHGILTETALYGMRRRASTR